LTRLSVTSIDVAELFKPPVVAWDASLADARRAMEGGASPWVVVLDAAERLRGWVGRTSADGDGVVSDRARRLEAWVPATASLKQAFSEMLLHDAGWVAVLDTAHCDRYLGVLTPDALHQAMRRSMDAEADGSSG
jgi:osmoprotectant transport system ATP-binding protein